ncbi:hypothetical protein BC831DRAFT_63408 [Entophlyctis helioformis]|nr:hypothetical protein BC831DRAFT_63408 [Entophlyctis helioformis]
MQHHLAIFQTNVVALSVPVLLLVRQRHYARLLGLAWWGAWWCSTRLVWSGLGWSGLGWLSWLLPPRSFTCPPRWLAGWLAGRHSGQSDQVGRQTGLCPHRQGGDEERAAGARPREAAEREPARRCCLCPVRGWPLSRTPCQSACHSPVSPLCFDWLPWPRRIWWPAKAALNVSWTWSGSPWLTWLDGWMAGWLDSWMAADCRGSACLVLATLSCTQRLTAHAIGRPAPVPLALLSTTATDSYSQLPSKSSSPLPRCLATVLASKHKTTLPLGTLHLSRISPSCRVRSCSGTGNTIHRWLTALSVSSLQPNQAQPCPAMPSPACKHCTVDRGFGSTWTWCCSKLESKHWLHLDGTDL